MMYTLFVTLDVHPDKLAEFVDAITTNAAASLRDEPGCLTFDVHQDIANATRFYLYEIYADEDAFTIGHRGAPHYAQWQQAAKACVVAGSHQNAFARPVRMGNSGTPRSSRHALTP
jgi:autoinducer 2-degrading protein